MNAMKRFETLKIYKTIFVVFVLGVILAPVSFAQTASATWALTADTAVVIAGNIAAPSQYLSKTALPTDTLTIKDYLGGAGGGVSERLWLNGTLWPNEVSTGKNNGRYIQYSVSPIVGNNLTVQSISLNIGCSGSTANMFASIWYSTDSTFTSSTLLYGPSSLTDIRTNSFPTLTFTPNTIVNDGMTFYLRIYPWFTTSPSATKYICIKNVVISGNTVTTGVSSISVFPDSLLFGGIHVNTSKKKTFSISAAYLTPASGEVTITAPAGFEVSTSSDSGFATAIAVPYLNDTLSATTIYTRFVPGTVASYYDSVSISGGGAATRYMKLSGTSFATEYMLGIFVSTTGSDADSGNYNHPYLTISKAISVAQPGDTIFVFGGVYPMGTTIGISSSGTDTSNRICLFAYGNARPILDFSSMAFSGSNRGINLIGSYWHIKGFDVCKAGDNGMNITGSNNIVEFCALYENQDTGLQLSGTASNNKIINCDSYYNYDAPNLGANADGFSPKQFNGVNNYFYGCRAWQNSDDGWDCFEAIASVTLENCWVFANGYLKDGSDPGTQANGNGFKLGGNYTENDAMLKNCLSFSNKTKGFDQNHNRGSMTLYNCTGYGNGGNNYAISEALNTGKTLTLTNCAELGNKISVGGFAVLTTNSWPVYTVTATDFTSLDTTEVRNPRKADGSLPDITFMHLALGSQLIDAGTILPGQLYNGSAPDLGCFESDYPTGVSAENIVRAVGFQLVQNYPNPFNPSTKIQFSVAKTGMAKLIVMNILGQEITTLFSGQAESGRIHTVQFNASSLPSGIYFSMLESNGKRDVKKMLLLK